MSFAIVGALPEEIAPLARRLAGRAPAGVGEYVQGSFRGSDVWMLATGDGPRHAGEALAELLRTVSFEAVFAIGLGGGLSSDLAVADLVVVERVIDESSGRSHELAASPWFDRGLRFDGAQRGTAVSAVSIAQDSAAKERLAKQTDATAVVDLESAAWCVAAEAAGLPITIARCVSDTAREALPLDFEALRDADGAVDRARVLRAALRRPQSWPGLWRLSRRLASSGERLADWAVECLSA